MVSRKTGKSGSVTIFVLLLFVSLVSMAMVFVEESKQKAVQGTTREMGLLWCESILGEYYLPMQKRYDLFGFYGMPMDVAGKVDYLADQSFRDRDLIRYEGARCYLYDYCLTDTAVFRRQIVRTGQLELAGKLIGKKNTTKKPASDAGGTGKDAGSTGSTGKPEENPGRRITGSGTLADLPSRGSPAGISADSLKSMAKGIRSMGDLLKKGGNQAFEDVYIRSHFRNRTGSPDRERHYFLGEMEYLVCGKPSDLENERGVRLRITALREPVNMAYLIGDPEKSAETMAAAQLLTPGPAAAATQKLLEAAWALAESNNDYNLLISGKKVPFVKTKASWAVDLDAVITGGLPKGGAPGGKSSGEIVKNRKEEKVGSGAEKAELPKLKPLEHSCIDPGNTSGDTYEDYLRGLLVLTGEEVKLLRMMDLIQINMQFCRDGGFLLRDYYAGLKVVLKVNGKEYDAEREYQPA